MVEEAASTGQVQESLASKGTISMSSVISVLTQGVANWINIVKGSFELCEINFTDPSLSKKVGGIIGFRFKVQNEDGSQDTIYISLEVMSAVKIAESSEESNVNNNA